MYRILIVDDEKSERECIRFLIEEAQLSLEIREASNGIEALEVLQVWQADILFTDVQMPYMDGLELIRQTTALLPDIKVLIFSSYADFEYARTAMTLGVNNYILKPVVPEELEKSLRRLMQQLEEEQNHQQQQNLQHTFLLQHALQASISGCFDAGTADTYVTEQLPTFRHMALLEFQGNLLENHAEAIYEGLRTVLGLDMESLNLSPTQALLLVRSPIENARRWGQQLTDYLHSSFLADCCLSVGLPLASYPTLKDAFSAIEQQMEQRFWSPRQTLFLPESASVSAPDSDAFDDEQQLTQIKRALAAKDREGLQEALTLLFSRYRLPSSQSQIYVKFIFSNLLTTLYPYLPAAPDTPSLDTLISDLYLQPDIAELIRLVQKLTDRILSGFPQASESVRREILSVTEYIRHNYDRDLSVEQLAAGVYLTPDYLSRLFKKAMGKSLSQYIRTFRMEKAQELLVQTNKKIIDIGSSVGYPNYSYFCQSFREFAGTSPEKYRQEHTL